MTTKNDPAFAVFEQVAAPPANTRLRDALDSHRPILLAAARVMVRNEAEAQDLVQTTFELALRRIDQLRDPSALRAWLLAIEAREAFRFVRRLRRLVALDSQGATTTAPGPSASEAALQVALGHLPARVRAAIVLHHLGGLSVDETGAALGTKPNTVKTQLRDGLRRMRQELGDD